MKTIRCFLATIVLLTLGGLSLFQGIGSASLANTVASHYASSFSTSSVEGKFKKDPPCGSAVDC
jgi:hypothetical protein